MDGTSKRAFPGNRWKEDGFRCTMFDDAITRFNVSLKLVFVSCDNCFWKLVYHVWLGIPELQANMMVLL